MNIDLQTQQAGAQLQVGRAQTFFFPSLLICEQIYSKGWLLFCIVDQFLMQYNIIDKKNRLLQKSIFKKPQSTEDTPQDQKIYICQSIIEYIIIIIFIYQQMGNQECQDCRQKTIQNQAYGAYEVVQEGSHTYALIEKKVQKKQQIQIRDKIINQLQMRKKIKNVHIVKLQKYNFVNQAYGLNVVMYYEYVPKSLRERLRQLQQREQIFTERQIFSMIYAVQSGLQELYKYKIKHSCLNLDTILIKNNTYKITDTSSLTYITSYHLASKGDRQQFLSQRLLQKLSFQSLYPIYNIDDDYFSLGLIALTIATDRSPEQFYIWTDKKHGSLNVKAIRQSIKKLENRYSSKLVKKIKQLLYQKDTETNEKTLICTTKMQQLEQYENKKTQTNKSLNSTVVSQHKSNSHINL